MGMELLTQTNPAVLKEFAQYLGRRALGMKQEFENLSVLVNSTEDDDWSGISRQAFLGLWDPFIRTFREWLFVMTRTAPVIEQLAEELAVAQDLYHKGRLAALDAGFKIGADGLIVPPAEGLASGEAIEAHELSSTMNEALAMAKEADERAAREIIGEGTGMYPALMGFVGEFADKAENVHGSLGAGLHRTADLLEGRAQEAGVAAAERARATQAAGQYRGLANKRALKGIPLLSVAISPLIYAQYVAEGDDRGLAGTKTAASVGLGAAGAGAGLAVGTWVAAPLLAVPPLAFVTIAGFTYFGNVAGSSAGEAAAPGLHRYVVSPFSDGIDSFFREAAEVDPWWQIMPYDQARFP